MGRISQFLPYATSVGNWNSGGLVNGGEGRCDTGTGRSSKIMGLYYLSPQELGLSGNNTATSISVSLRVKIDASGSDWFNGSTESHIICTHACRGSSIVANQGSWDIYPFNTNQGWGYDTWNNKSNQSNWTTRSGTLDRSGTLFPFGGLVDTQGNKWYRDFGVQVCIESNNSVFNVSTYIDGLTLTIDYTDGCFVKFVSNEGHELSEEGYENNAVPRFNGNLYTPPGYKFKGWRSSQTNTVYEASTPESVILPATNDRDVTYSPVFEPQVYQINLSDEGADIASNPSTIYLKYNTQWQDSSGAKITTITPPQKTGYTFLGYRNSSLSMVITEDGVLLDDHLTFTRSNATLYAVWSEHYYYVTYRDPLLNSYFKSQYVQYSQSFNLLTDDINIIQPRPNYYINYDYDPKNTGVSGVSFEQIAYPQKLVGWSMQIDTNSSKTYSLGASVSKLTPVEDGVIYLDAIWGTADAILELGNKATKNWHEFAGWADDNNNLYMTGSILPLQQNIDLNGQWSKTQFRSFINIIPEGSNFGTWKKAPHLFQANKKVKKIFIYITSENNGSGTWKEV